MDCYKYLEPLYLDYRKLKRQNKDGSMTYSLLASDNVCCLQKAFVNSACETVLTFIFF